MSRFKEVWQLSAEVESYADSIDKMFHDALERFDENAACWENSMLGIIELYTSKEISLFFILAYQKFYPSHLIFQIAKKVLHSHFPF
jgi:hypothetical protein